MTRQLEEAPRAEAGRGASFVLRLRAAGRILRDTALRWWKSEAPSQGAALAFYTLFSLAPVLLIAIAIASVVVGEEVARQEIERQFRILMGEDSARLAAEVMRQAADSDDRFGAGVFGLGALLVGATTVFNQLQEALNDAWGVRPQPGHWLRSFLRKRLLSFGIVLAVGFVLVVSLAVSAAIASAGDLLGRWLGIGAALVALLNFAFFFLLLTLLFALIFRIVPDARIPWRDAFVGGLFTALAIAIGKLGIDRYLGESTVASVYGVAGSVVILLVWIYYSSMILLLGAAFTRVYSQPRRPAGVEPEPGAEQRPRRSGEPRPSPARERELALDSSRSG
jgi:membrane protein